MRLRPVLWLGLAYITGELLAWVWPKRLNEVAAGCVAAAAALFGMIILKYVLKKQKTFTGSTRMKKTLRKGLLFVLPVFLFIGYLKFSQVLESGLESDRCLQSWLDGEMEGGLRKGEGGGKTMQGRVMSVEEKTNSWYVYVDGCEGILADSVLVSISKEDAPDLDMACIPGDWVHFSGEAELFSHPSNEGAFDEWLYYHSRGILARVWADSVSVVRQEATFWEQGAWALSSWMRKNCGQYLSERSAGVAVSMVCGDKSMLDRALKELYQRSGISHILAISGLHITFIGMGTYRLLKRFGFSHRLCLWSGLLFMACYGWFTGMAPSTMRAVIMTGLSLGARISGRTYDRPTALSLAALVILVPSPLMITQPGFLLSFIAAGSLALCPPLPAPGAPKKGKRPIRALAARISRLLIAPVFVTIGMLPAIAWCFFEIPVYSIAVNLAVIPLMSIAYPAMLLCAIAGPLLGPLVILPAWLIEGVLSVYEWLCRLSMELPGAVLIVGKPSPEIIVLSYMLFGAAAAVVWFFKDSFGKSGRNAPSGVGGNKAALAFRGKGGPIFSSKAALPGNSAALLRNSASLPGNSAAVRRNRVALLRNSAALLLSLLGVLILTLPIRPEGMTVTMVDVGQGDCFFIQLADGTNILVDGGSSDQKNMGQYILLPFLKSRGVRRLDAVFLSHMDSDHICGVQEMLEASLGGETNGSQAKKLVPGSITVENLFLPWNVRESGGGEALLALAGALDIPCFGLKTGDLLTFGKLKLTVVSPDKEQSGEQLLSSENLDRNDTSLVFCVSYGDFDMLFTGDVGQAVEERIVENMKAFGIGPCDVLKVAHHGSKGSSTQAFLDYVRPAAALISCGKDNSYGHPHKELIKRLQRVTENICISAQRGEWIVSTNGNFIKIVVWTWMDSYNNMQEVSFDNEIQNGQ